MGYWDTEYQELLDMAALPSLDKKATVESVYAVQDCSQPVLLSVKHHYT